MRKGDLSGLPGPAVMDPLTGAPFHGNQIPTSQLNSVGQRLLNLYVPLPNVANGADTNANYRRQTRSPGTTNGYDVRIDHNLSAKQQTYARWSWKNLNSTVANPLLPSDSDRETNRH